MFELSIALVNILFIIFLYVCIRIANIYNKRLAYWKGIADIGDQLLLVLDEEEIEFEELISLPLSKRNEVLRYLEFDPDEIDEYIEFRNATRDSDTVGSSDAPSSVMSMNNLRRSMVRENSRIS